MVNPVKVRSEEMQGATAVTPVINLQMAEILSNGGGTARKRDGDIEETIWTKLLARKWPARARNSRLEKRGAGVYQRDDQKRYRRPKEREGKTKEMEQRLFPRRRCGLGILRMFGGSVRRASGTFWKQRCRFPWHAATVQISIWCALPVASLPQHNNTNVLPCSCYE